MSSDPRDQSLRVLVANEGQERLGIVTDVLAGLGHVVVAAGIDIDEIGGATSREHPDVALVALGDNSEHALELIDKIVHEAACPVIALLHTSDPHFVNEAAKRGIFAHINETTPTSSSRRWTSSCGASPSTTTSRAPSPAAPRSSRRRAS